MKSIDKPVVYLSGKIGGLTLEQATLWRKTVSSALEHKFEFIDPTQGLNEWVKPGEVIRTVEAPNYEHIFERDMASVFQCDVLVANLLASNNLFGTPFELGVAFAQAKPIIIASRDKHPFYDCAYRLVSSVYGIYSELLNYHEKLSRVPTDVEGV